MAKIKKNLRPRREAKKKIAKPKSWTKRFKKALTNTTDEIKRRGL